MAVPAARLVEAQGDETIPTWPAKDPNEVLDYGIDWSTRLASGDTLATSTWTVPSGLTAGAESETTTTTTQWLSGGRADVTYKVTNRVTTADGRTMDQSVLLPVEDK